MKKPLLKPLLAIVWVSLLTAVLAARAEDVTNASHSVVRFEVSTGGTNFGSVDLELFDQEKPVTVRNFLRYVHGGGYSNLVLHRLDPNSYLQAGSITVTNPGSTAEFHSHSPEVNYGPIINESGVGPALSNEYGTLAMARLDGQANSASSQFFFNLTNNSFLNTNESGGYCVFGRVVNTAGPRSGTNLLNYFNTLSDSNGIGHVNISVSEVLNQLPVSANRAAPLVADLFTVNAAILRGPQTPATNHSVVRFDVSTGGAHYGNIDIELFDQDKPVTTRNFLLYVYSGVYSNLVLHRMIPNFVMQGGKVRLPEPDSSAAFSTYTPGVNWGAITNETHFGPELGNDFGTIAMASIAGEPNSAAAEFFFNLTNNPFLNTNEGGYCVFGRVVSSYDDRSGTNLLASFNTFTRGHGLRFWNTLNPADIFEDLMVSQDRSTPLYSDLFTVRASVLQGATLRDTNAPVVTVSEPATAVARTTNATFRFAGTAGDNQAVVRVFCDTANGRFVTDGSTNWSGDLPLTPGTNHFLVRSLDFFGNLSPGQERTVFYSVPRHISLLTLGKGKVTGITNGQIMEVGVTYALSAKPAKGYYFLGWRGALFNNSPLAYFTLQGGTNAITTNVTVRFSKSFLGTDTGAYQGVFFPGTNGPPESSGYISLKIANNGVYSGQLKPLGASYVIRGRFDQNGQSIIYGVLGTNVLELFLAWSGEGTENFSGAYLNGHFASLVSLWRVPSFGPTNPAPLAGDYTFQLSPPQAANNGVTDGSGFGTLAVDAKGRINLTANLADGVSFKQKSTVLASRRFVFYSTTKKGDSVVGLGAFDASNSLHSVVKWFGPQFPGATNQNLLLNGARYTPPPQQRLFDWTNGLVTLSGDGLAAPLTAAVMLQDDGSLTGGANTNHLQLTFTNATGLFGGSFTHPASSATTVLRGAVLQSSNTAAGYFPGAARGGAFEIRRAP